MSAGPHPLCDKWDLSWGKKKDLKKKKLGFLGGEMGILGGQGIKRDGVSWAMPKAESILGKKKGFGVKNWDFCVANRDSGCDWG